VRPRKLVVAALVRDGSKILMSRRRADQPMPNLWEFPGGKVEPGETDEEALARECREELGIDVTVGHRVGEDWPLHNGYVMHVWTATIANGEPAALEHSDLRWLTEAELFDVPWLPADLLVLEAIRSHLKES
jgi:8-oxo-dGTP diphosphatase